MEKTVNKNIFIQMISGANGQISNKRMAGNFLLISAIVYAFIYHDIGMVSVILGAGVGLFATGAITKT